MPEIHRSQKGRLKLSDDVYKGDWDLVSPIFKKFRPLHIEPNFAHNIWVLTGESADFKRLEEGEIIPFYTAVAYTDGSVQFELSDYLK